MPTEEIRDLCNQFVAELSPARVYLFGSFADGTYTDQSDYDFYIVVKDGAQDLAALTTRAHRSIRKLKNRPVDIIVGTESRFDQRKVMPTVEHEVFQKGVLLYG